MELKFVDPRALKENPDKARRSKSNPQSDALLLATIKAVGIIQPPVVVPETDGGNGFVMVKMPTEDISRTAFCLAHPAAARGLLYSMCRVVEPRVQGHWAFEDVELYRKRGLDIYAKAVGASEADCLYMPPIFYGEQKLEPEKWLPEMLAKYGAASQEQ